ncbi:MAG: transcription termination/antitermination protein NusG [Pirellulales bacterium]|nr:transcription termination/antitermination protein NusG [Pirellulales bacterium]
MNESAREPTADDETQVSSPDAAQENEQHQSAPAAEESPGGLQGAAHSLAADVTSDQAVPAGVESVASEAAGSAAVEGGPSASDGLVDGDVEDEDDEQYSGDEDAQPIEILEDDSTAVTLGEDEVEADGEMKWYILKVQSNREDSIRDALVRRMKIAGLENCVSQVIVPKESITEFKGGRKRVRKHKIYPGYIVVHMVINEETWFLVRETPGIGDFTGAAGKPTPMLPSEVERIKELEKPEEEKQKEKINVTYELGERVKVTEGNFLNMEGEVEAVDATNQRITVLIQIFGRPTPVELEYWQVQRIE